jgi:hypothetical protein
MKLKDKLNNRMEKKKEKQAMSWRYCGSMIAHLTCDVAVPGSNTAPPHPLAECPRLGGLPTGMAQYHGGEGPLRGGRVANLLIINQKNIYGARVH